MNRKLFILRHMALLYWRIIKPVVFNVRLLVVHKDEVLLVSHTYTKGWYLPGGEAKKGELFTDAMKRETQEELGVELSDVYLFGVYQSRKEIKYDTIVVYLRVLHDKITSFHHDAEIADIQWFPIHNLPPGTSPATRKRIQEYVDKRFPITTKW